MYSDNIFEEFVFLIQINKIFKVSLKKKHFVKFFELYHYISKMFRFFIF